MINFVCLYLYLVGERNLKSDVTSLLVEKSAMEGKINSLLSSRYSNLWQFSLQLKVDHEQGYLMLSYIGLVRVS